MSIQELQSAPEDAVIRTDICIVGSGPAGVTLAQELKGVGRVLVLESGGLEPSAADELNRIESVGRPRVMDQTLVRQRIVGGSSSTWWGRSATFDASDFLARPWVAHSGWPITRDELRPYFGRAARRLDIGVDDNMDAPELARPEQPRFDTHLIEPYHWTFSRGRSDREEPLRFGPDSLRQSHVDALLHATVVHIDTDPAGGHVTGLRVRTADGSIRRVEASRYVLAAGGIENARLLLASNHVVRHGVGNAHDTVGRYLMDHLRGCVGSFDLADARAVQRTLGRFRIRGRGGRIRVIPGGALAPAVQRAEGLLQASLWVEGEIADDDPLEAAKSLLRDRDPRRALDVVRGAPLVAETLVRTRLQERSALRKRKTLWVECMVEQAPDPESRIVLGERLDAHGVPISVIDWRYGEQEARTVRRASAIFVEELERLRLPAPRLDDAIRDGQATFLMPDVAHPTGTTRMSASARDGVVDADCRVHGLDNLYIAGSSVFPTSGHANPTQTIVALAVRLADHLRVTR